MVVGHTRCLVDGHFGLLKRLYRRHDIFTLPQLLAVAEASANTNYGHLVDGSETWREWDTFLGQFFHLVKGVRKILHFRFDAESPGVIFTRQAQSDDEVTVNLLKKDVTVHNIKQAPMPPVLQAGGLTFKRQKYLYDEIRQHIPDDFKDDLCPPPPPQPEAE